MSLVSSVFIYLPLYLLMRGNIVVDEQKWWKFHFQRANKGDQQISHMRRQSFIMLAYPFAYSIIFLPLSIVRWLSFADDGYVPRLSIMFVASSLFGLSGLINVVLLLTTKPESGLFGQLMFKRPAKPHLPPPASPVPHDLEAARYTGSEQSEATTLRITVSPPSPTSDLRCRDCGRKVEMTQRQSIVEKRLS
jgi:hypothetical protein